MWFERVLSLPQQAQRNNHADWRQTPVYQRERLPLDAELTGPAIIQQLDATAVVEPGNRLRVDRHGNLIIKVKSAWEQQHHG